MPTFLDTWDEDLQADRARWEALLERMRVEAEVDAARERAGLYDEGESDA